jgi:hypothetical protein
MTARFLFEPELPERNYHYVEDSRHRGRQGRIVFQHCFQPQQQLILKLVSHLDQNVSSKSYD